MANDYAKLIAGNMQFRMAPQKVTAGLSPKSTSKLQKKPPGWKSKIVAKFTPKQKPKSRNQADRERMANLRERAEVGAVVTSGWGDRFKVSLGRLKNRFTPKQASKSRNQVAEERMANLRERAEGFAVGKSKTKSLGKKHGLKSRAKISLARIKQAFTPKRWSKELVYSKPIGPMIPQAPQKLPKQWYQELVYSKPIGPMIPQAPQKLTAVRLPTSPKPKSRSRPAAPSAASRSGSTPRPSAASRSGSIKKAAVSLGTGSRSVVGNSWATKIGLVHIPILNQYRSFDEFYKAAASDPAAWNLYNTLYNAGKLELVQKAYAKKLLPYDI